MDMDINEEVNISCSGEMEVMKLNTDIDSLAISLNALTLSPDSTEVVVHIAGNTTKKYLKENLGMKQFCLNSQSAGQ